MLQEYRYLKHCRLCGKDSLKFAFGFGDLPLGNNLQLTLKSAKECSVYPLGLNWCSSCGHIQLTHAINNELLYATNYTYLSSVGKSFLKHFEDFVEWACKITSIDKGELVVDVGSNDGSCLSFFKRKGMRVCGVDPASFAVEKARAKGVYTVHDFFGVDVARQVVKNFGQATLVTTHNVLAHVDNLHEVFDAIDVVLAERGWLCIEVGYFGLVYQKGLIDTIYHEHLDYHTAGPFVQFLEARGLTVVSISTNGAQGGTIRILSQKKRTVIRSEKITKFIKHEKDSLNITDETLRLWKSSIISKIRLLGESLLKFYEHGSRIVAYGAPTKATLLLREMQLKPDVIVKIYEDNDLKVGRFMPGSGIPICSAENMRLTDTDTVLILAWNFRDDIVAKLHKKSSVQCRVVVPLPQLEIGSLR